MKVTFSWKDAAEAISPICSSEAVNKDGISLLSCLLMDDGGVPYRESILWIRKGIVKIDSVLNGEIKTFSWDRESWGALMAIDDTKIYSLHDEAYFECVTLQQLRNALVSWEVFLKSKPNLGERREIEL